jgi:Multicopper oxidase
VHGHHSHSPVALEELPTETEGLPEATRSEVVELADGDEFDLEITPVAKRIGDATVRMLAYNRSIPGPTLRIPQRSTVTVHVANRGDLEATVHWHGGSRTVLTERTTRRRRSESGRRSRTRSPSPTQAPTGTTRTSARTTARRWVSTGISSSTRLSLVIGRR